MYFCDTFAMEDIKHLVMQWPFENDRSIKYSNMFSMSQSLKEIFNHFPDNVLVQYGHLIPYINKRDLRADFMPTRAIAAQTSGW